MKKNDLIFIFALILFFAPFFIFDKVFEFYENMNIQHSLIMSFLKFAILATLGEVIGLRIKTGSLYKKGFGVLPRAVVWGFLGIAIKVAFEVFGKGTPAFLVNIGFEIPEKIAGEGIRGIDVLIAFSISTLMNVFFAPVMMTIHKITDTHIEKNNGKLSCLLKRIQFGEIMSEINWRVQWNFVFKKTIPLFWIPAHTITFLLPADYRVLFAAVLGIVLGVLLAVASIKGTEKNAAK